MTSASRTPASADDSLVDWEAVRQAYVNQDTPVRDICRAHGIFSQALYRRAGKEGWPRRREPREDAEARKTWKLLTRLRRLAKDQIDQIETRRAGASKVPSSGAMYRVEMLLMCRETSTAKAFSAYRAASRISSTSSLSLVFGFYFDLVFR